MGTSVRLVDINSSERSREENPTTKWLSFPIRILKGQSLPLTSMTLRARPAWTCFYLGDCLRGLNLNPTLKMIEKLGGAKKKGEKYIKLEEFFPLYREVKNSKDQGSFEDL